MAKSLAQAKHAASYARFSNSRPDGAARQNAVAMEHMEDRIKSAGDPRPSPSRIAIYCRSAKNDSGQLNRQRRLCTDFIAAHFPDAVAETFVDVGQPANGLTKLRCKLFRAEFDAVVVESCDRLTRDFHTLQAILARLLISNVRLYTIHGGPEEVQLVRHVLWGAVARIDGDERLHSIGRDWWHQSGEAYLIGK